jgi:hypothetical protein
MATDKKLLAVLAKIAKAVSAEDLRDIEIVSSAAEGGGDGDAALNKVPSGAELVTGAPVAARGLDTPAQEARYGQFAPQEGVTKLYQELDGRMRGMEKAVSAFNKFLKAIKKAEDDDGNEDEEKSNKDEDEMGKSLRKARFAIRKADSIDLDTDDHSMADECYAKSIAALKAADATLSKAEDDAEDDDDEKKVEKARTELKALRAQFKSIQTRHAAAPAVATPAPAPAAVEKSAEVTAAETLSAQIADLAKGQGVTVADLIARMTNPAPALGGLTAAPVFSKATASNAAAYMIKADAERRAGNISDNEFQRVQGVISRVEAMKAGLHDPQKLASEIDALPTHARDIFRA